MAEEEGSAAQTLVEAFREHYHHRVVQVIASVGPEFGDPTVLARIGDNLDEFYHNFLQVAFTNVKRLIDDGMFNYFLRFQMFSPRLSKLLSERTWRFYNSGSEMRIGQQSTNLSSQFQLAGCPDPRRLAGMAAYCHRQGLACVYADNLQSKQTSAGWINDNCFQNGPPICKDSTGGGVEDYNSDTNSSCDESAGMTASDKELEVARMLRVRDDGVATTVQTRR
jgi:hypothetical protein